MKTVVEIEWDSPEEQAWLCDDNISIALHSYCTNTKFKVRSLDKELAATVRPVGPANTASLKLPTAEEICAFNKIDVDSNYGGVVKETLEAIRQLQA